MYRLYFCIENVSDQDHALKVTSIFKSLAATA